MDLPRQDSISNSSSGASAHDATSRGYHAATKKWHQIQHPRGEGRDVEGTHEPLFNRDVNRDFGRHTMPPPVSRSCFYQECGAYDKPPHMPSPPGGGGGSGGSHHDLHATLKLASQVASGNPHEANANSMTLKNPFQERHHSGGVSFDCYRPERVPSACNSASVPPHWRRPQQEAALSTLVDQKMPPRSHATKTSSNVDILQQDDDTCSVELVSFVDDESYASYDDDTSFFTEQDSIATETRLVAIGILTPEKQPDASMSMPLPPPQPCSLARTPPPTQLTPRMSGRTGQSSTIGGTTRTFAAGTPYSSRALPYRLQKSDSLGSTSPPPIPIRRNSVHNVGGNISDRDRTEDDDRSTSGQSVASATSGVDLDDKLRERIIATRSNSLLIARRASINTNTSTSEHSTKEAAKSPHLARTASKVASMPNTTSSSDVACDEKNTGRRQGQWMATPRHRRSSAEGKGGDMAATAALVASKSSSDLHKTEKDTLRLAASFMGRDLSSSSMPSSVHTPTQSLEPNEEEESQDLEAQAGVPVVLPGAFAVTPLDATGELTGYDSGFEDTGSDDGQEVSAEFDQPMASEGIVAEEEPTFRPVVTDAPVEAQLYHVDYADAQVLDEEADTDKAIGKRVRVMQSFLVLLFCVIVGGVALVILYTTSGGAGACDSDSACVPQLEGWELLGELIVGPTDTDSIQFGHSIAMSADGHRLAVGLPGLDMEVADTTFSKVGGVYIMDWNGTDWKHTAELFGSTIEGQAGSSVALSADGSRVAFAAPEAEGGGYVVLYEEQVDGTWTLQGGYLNGETTNSTVSFGSSLAMSMDGSVLAVGDKYAVIDNMDEVGILRVYQLENATWSQVGDDITGEASDDLLGWSVAMSDGGNRVAVAAVGADNLKGEVRIFDFSAENGWVKSNFNFTGINERETFGASVELADNGNVLAIGANGYSSSESTGVGRVCVYRFDEASEVWEPMGSPLVGEAQFDRYGTSISLSEDGNTLAVGSPESDVFASNAGFVEVLEYDGHDWISAGSLLGRADSEGGLFGSSVTLSALGDVVAGGAPSLTFDGKLSKVGQVGAYLRADFD